ncbi:flavin monoamine oxidase family protein [Rhizobium sp. Root708]|uniref:flavin monoamine oxidase family protein n=1 Tax=Rhizobium sp. Root708 TaxID=1736592 RepID=UPI000AAF86AE
MATGRCTSALPDTVDLRLGVSPERLELTSGGVRLSTSGGKFTAHAAILTVSSHVLASGTIDLPVVLDDWRHAASLLPLGNNEKLFLEIVGPSPFLAETHVIGDPSDPETGSYYIMPLGMAVIECFLGGAGARSAASMGPEAAFARAVEQLAALFGTSVRSCLKPLVASNWAGTASIGGGYSHALPGHAAARQGLARSYDDRVFFAGEATHKTDFSTAHGAYVTGLRAAEEVLAALRSA